MEMNAIEFFSYYPRESKCWRQRKISITTLLISMVLAVIALLALSIWLHPENAHNERE